MDKKNNAAPKENVFQLHIRKIVENLYPKHITKGVTDGKGVHGV